MKRNLSIFFLLLVITLTLQAQQQQHQRMPRRFSPELFDKQLTEFITREASLSESEAEKFFPVYKEMWKQQRLLMKRQHEVEHEKPADEEGCKKAVQERDDIQLEQRRIQQTYHNRFFEILPASKVYDVLKAEEKFHRQQLKQWDRGPKASGNECDGQSAPKKRPGLKK